MSVTVTPAEVAAWANIENIDDSARSALMQNVIDAAVGIIDAISLEWPDDPATEHPGRTAATELAVKMQSARWWARRDSPQGVAGFGVDYAVRVSRVDPDVEALIRPWVAGAEP